MATTKIIPENKGAKREAGEKAEKKTSEAKAFKAREDEMVSKVKALYVAEGVPEKYYSLVGGWVYKTLPKKKRKSE